MNSFREWITRILSSSKMGQKFLPGKRGWNFLILSSSTVFSQTIGILFTPILTRLYQPEAFGALALFVSTISLVRIIISGRYEWAMLAAQEDEAIEHLLGLCVILICLSCLLLTIILFIFIKPIQSSNLFAPLGNGIWFVPVALLGEGFYQTLNYYATRKRRFSTIARTRLTQVGVMYMVQAGAGLLQVGALGLLTGDMLGRISAGFQLLLRHSKNVRDGVLNSSFADIIQTAKRYIHFPIYSVPSSLLNSAGTQLPTYLLTMIYDTRVVGWFGLSQLLIAAPITLVGASISQVFWADATELIHQDPRKLQSIYIQITTRLVALGLTAGIVLALISPWLFQVVFGGKEWYNAGVYTQLMTPMLITGIAISPLSHLVIHELQNLQLLWDFIRVVLVLIGFILAQLYKWPAEISIVVYSAVSSLMYLILFLLNLYALRRNINLKTT